MRAWFEANHATEKEVWIGYYKVDSKRQSVTWSQTVDEALCVGWIDGIRKKVDAVSYANRFTPRRRGSNWSAVNIARVTELKRLGLMRPAGLAAFNVRKELRAPYSYENRKTIKLGPALLKRLKAAKAAYRFFEAQPPSARHLAVFYVMSAKQQETRERRLANLIASLEKGNRPGTLPPPKRGRRA